MGGCADHLSDEHLHSLAQHIDDIAAKVEEFGTASMSAPVFTSPEETFKFSLTGVDATQFYNDAKQSVQARIADFAQAANIVGLGANVAVDPTQAAAYLAQLAQYKVAEVQTAQATAVVAQKQAILNDAALETFRLQLEQARKETDPDKRAKMMADAQTAFASQYQAPSPQALPAFPTAAVPAPAATDIAKSGSDAAGIFATTQFSGFQGLLQNRAGPTISDRQALFIAAGDNATAAIFKALGDPALANKFNDKKVLLGVVTVAVNPGWRTKQGYSADLAMRVYYQEQPARLAVVQNFVNNPRNDLGLRKRVAMSYGLPLPSGAADPFDPARVIPEAYRAFTPAELRQAFPLVSAVSPMTQTQVEEDLNSRRQQLQVALDLAGALHSAGLNAQANFFDHFARSLQQDADTVNATVAVNTYSFNGGVFGFEIGPRLRAVAHPSKLNSAPGDTLERQSFPSLILLGFGEDELRPRVRVDRFGQFRLVELAIVMDQTSKWNSLNGNLFGWLPVRAALFRNKPFSEETRLYLEDELSRRLRRIRLNDASLDDDQASGEARRLLERLASGKGAGAAHSAGLGTPQMERGEACLVRTVATAALQTAKSDSKGVKSPDNLAALLVAVLPEIGSLSMEPTERPGGLGSKDLQSLITCATPIPAGHPDPDVFNRLTPGERQALVRFLDAYADDAAQCARQRVSAAAEMLSTQLKRTSLFATLQGGASSYRAEAIQTLRQYVKLLEMKIKLDRRMGDAERTLAAAAESRETTPRGSMSLSDWWRVFVAPAPSPTSRPAAGSKEQQPDPPIADLQRQRDALEKQDSDLRDQLTAQVARLRELQQAIDLMRAQAIEIARQPPVAADDVARTAANALDVVGAATDVTEPYDQSAVHDATRNLMKSRLTSLIYKYFGSDYVANLPVQLVDGGGAIKHPRVSAVAHDFVPGPGHEAPARDEKVAVQLTGKDLDAIDPAGIDVLSLKQPRAVGPDVQTPVVINGTPTVTATLITLDVSINPAYHLPFAFQLKLKGGTDSILSPPIAVSPPAPTTRPTSAIYEMTGPADDPTRQEIRRQEFFNLPPDVVKRKIDERKDEKRSTIDINLNRNK